MVYLSTLWFTLVHSGTLWYTIVHFGILWYTLIHSGTLWYTLVHSGILGTPYYILVYFVAAIKIVIGGKHSVQILGVRG